MTSPSSRLTAALACLLFNTHQAAALSCIAPDAVRLYTQARDSAETFAIVKGRLHPEAPIAIPAVPTDGTMSREMQTTTRVRMTGVILGQDAFDTAFDREVDVTVSCLSVWCGTPVTDREILAALRLTDSVPELVFGPCGGDAMVVEDEAVERLIQCHRTGRCEVR